MCREDGPEAAGSKAEVALADLVKAHGELAHLALRRMRANLSVNRKKFARAERDLVALTKLLEGAGVKDDSFTQLGLMTTLGIQKEAELSSTPDDHGVRNGVGSASDAGG